MWRFLRPGGVRERLRSEMLFLQDRRSVFNTSRCTCQDRRSVSNTSCLCVYQMFRKRCSWYMYIDLYSFYFTKLTFHSLWSPHGQTGPLITEYIISYVFSVFLTDLVNEYKDFREQVIFYWKINYLSLPNLCVVFLFFLIRFGFYLGGRVHIPHIT